MDQTDPTDRIDQTDQIRQSRAAILRKATLTGLKLPLYPVLVPTS